MGSIFVFGWRTALLGVAAVEMLVIATALLGTLRNRTANRCLAALLLILAGLLTPDIIGFAGFYDAFPWLSFAPFAIPLAVGPLVYFYAFALTHGTLPRRAALHLLPAFLQFAYQLGSFCLPLALKSRWDGAATPIVDPVVTLGVLIGLTLYCVASLRLLRRFRAVLADQRSDDDRYAARWLSRTVAAMLLLLAAWGVYSAYDRLIARLDYFSGIGLYLIIALIGCYLAIEGWRRAELLFALVDCDPVPPPEPRDWRPLAQTWEQAVRANRWYEDPELSVASLARMLGTNTTYVSRAINEGLGVNFSTFIARLRSESVAEAIRGGSQADLLSLALDAGFGSKASFNRAFHAAFGQSPSRYRASHSKK